MNDEMNERPFNETIGRPHLTARLVNNLRDEFMNHNDIHPDDKYLLIEIRDIHYYYDFHNRKFRLPHFSGYSSYREEPFREYIVSFKSFLLSGELDFDDDDANNDTVKLHFIWTRLRSSEEVSTRHLNSKRPWDYINNNLPDISPQFFDYNIDDGISNYWIDQKDIYQIPNDPNIRRPRFVLFHLGEHGRKITDPLGDNRPLKRDITPNDILKLENRGQRIFSGATTNDMYGRRARVINDMMNTRKNRKDFENTVNHASSRIKPGTKRKVETNILSLPDDNIKKIGEYLSGPHVEYGSGRKGGKKRKTKRRKSKRKRSTRKKTSRR
jgi:hypothetical protein